MRQRYKYVRAQYPTGPPELRPAATDQYNPIILIRRAFARCPDDAPAPHIERLPFVANDEFRRNLETDLDAVDRAIAGGQWKAATVLGGSIVEALLVWAIQQKADPAAIQTAIGNVVAAGTPGKDPGKELEKWHLLDYIVIAGELKLIRAASSSSPDYRQGHVRCIRRQERSFSGYIA